MSTKAKPEPSELLHEDDIHKYLELSHKKVVIMDLHKDWCGPTMAIIPFLTQVWEKKYNKLLKYKLYAYIHI